VTTSNGNSKVKPYFKIDGKWVKNFTIDKRSIFTKSSSIWYNLRKRCNNFGSVKNPAYRDVWCSENFEDFQYFAEWCQHQKGYFEEGWELDKDILFEGNRFYSEDNCVFVPQYLNSLLVKPRSKGSKFLLGTFPIAESKLIKACIQNNGNLEYLGCFKTQEEAHIKYLERKSEICLEMLESLKNSAIDERVLLALSNLSKNYLIKAKGE